jgi:hypothetical protein
MPYGSGGVGVGDGDADVQGWTHMVGLMGGEVSTITNARALSKQGRTRRWFSFVCVDHISNPNLGW